MADEPERRRRQAVRAVEGGTPRATVAAVLDVHDKTVARWTRAAGTPGGRDARPPPGPSPGLTGGDLRRLGGLLARGAKARRAIPERRLGWASRKPRRGSGSGATRRWRGGSVASPPRAAREARGRKAFLAPLGEPGLSLAPAARRPLAPRGRTPVLVAWDRRDRRSAISAVTARPAAARPTLGFGAHPHPARGEQAVALPADLRRRRGPLTVVRGRGPVRDEARAVRAWPAAHPGVATEKFPGAVPDPDPDEGAWGWAEYGRPADPAAEDAGALLGGVTDPLVEVALRPTCSGASSDRPTCRACHSRPDGERSHTARSNVSVPLLWRSSCTLLGWPVRPARETSSDLPWAASVGASTGDLGRRLLSAAERPNRGGRVGVADVPPFRQRAGGRPRWSSPRRRHQAIPDRTAGRTP